MSSGVPLELQMLCAWGYEETKETRAPYLCIFDLIDFLSFDDPSPVWDTQSSVGKWDTKFYTAYDLNYDGNMDYVGNTGSRIFAGMYDISNDSFNMVGGNLPCGSLLSSFPGLDFWEVYDTVYRVAIENLVDGPPSLDDGAEVIVGTVGISVPGSGAMINAQERIYSVEDWNASDGLVFNEIWLSNTNNATTNLMLTDLDCVAASHNVEYVTQTLDNQSFIINQPSDIYDAAHVEAIIGVWVLENGQLPTAIDYHFQRRSNILSVIHEVSNANVTIKVDYTTSQALDLFCTTTQGNVVYYYVGGSR